MKRQRSKKLFAFIITVMMFSALPQLANAQKNKPCPPGYRLVCYRDPWSGTRVCRCEHNGNGKITGDNETSKQSTTINSELENSRIASIKIYDATGRLIKTFIGAKVIQGENKIEWDLIDDNGRMVPTGTYLLKVESKDKIETKKFYIS